MNLVTKGTICALAIAAMLVNTGVRAQEAGKDASSAPAAVKSAAFINPYLERHPTSEQVAENSEKTVLIHFTTYVFNTTVLSLVYSVQSYYRVGYRKFVILIQSGGGSVDAAQYAYETLSNMPIEVSTVAVGPVDSAGVMLYCMGSKRYASPGSSFLFHPIVGSLTHNRRSQEAAQRLIDARTMWVEGVNKTCFGGAPDEWDLERRDFRVLVGEAREAGMVNTEGSYFDEVGEVGAIAYIPPYYPPSSYSAQ